MPYCPRNITYINNGIVTWDVCSIKNHKIQTTPIPTKHELNKPTNESRSTQCRVTFHQNEKTTLKTRRYIRHENHPKRVLIMDKTCYYMTSLQTHLKCMAEQEANILIFTKLFRSTKFTKQTIPLNKGSTILRVCYMHLQFSLGNF